MREKRKGTTKGRLATVNRDRFKELVHYVCALCADAPEKLGATKLNKALWYVDTIAYCKFGKSISGETAYQKQEHGPVPKHIRSALEELQAEGRIAVTEKDYFGYTKREFVSLKSPDVSTFSEEEQTLIDQVVRIICDEYTAASISELSHDAIWEAAELGEDIPVYAVLASARDDITKQDKAWANKIIDVRTKVAREVKERISSAKGRKRARAQ